MVDFPTVRQKFPVDNLEDATASDLSMAIGFQNLSATFSVLNNYVQEYSKVTGPILNSFSQSSLKLCFGTLCYHGS